MNDPLNDFGFAPPQADLRAARRRLAVPAFAIAFVFLCSLLVQVGAVAVIRRYFPALLEIDWFPWILSMVPMYGVAMPLSLLLFRLAPPEEPASPRGKLSFPAFLGLWAICISLTFAGNILGQIVNSIIGSITGEMPSNDLESLTLASPLWINLLFAGILAPVMEEIFYRKLVIDRLRPFGDLPAILLSGLLFGLIHGNFHQFFYAAAIGLLFGYIYLYTGSIKTTLALHMCINLMGGVYSVEMLKKFDLVLFETAPMTAILDGFGGFSMMMSYLAFAAIAIIATPVAIVLLRRYLRLQKSRAPLSPAQWAKVLLLNPGVWILALVILYLFLG
ncbi:MAG: CPBP family intramembrane metalloprotease [Clostridia bacterium]|nr:CPBP family intramembrane metalloprotease [Clostridia bacterium]